MAEMSTPKATVRVGIFFMLGLVALLGFSFFVSDAEFGKQTYPLIAHFEEGQGLEVGSDVTIRGVPAGKVERIEFHPAGPEGKRVRVLLSMNSRYQLPVDSVATVRFQSLLGQNFVYVIDGNATERLRPGDEILTDEGADLQKVISQLAGLGEKTEGFMDDLREKANLALDQINTVIEENRENIRQTTLSFANAGPKIEALADNVDQLAIGLREGRGTLGKLFTDDTAYDNIAVISEDLKDILGKIKAGEGTIGRLVNEEDMHEELLAAFANLAEAAEEFKLTLGENREDIRNFVEQLGAAGPSLRETVEDARDIASKINEGHGTIGKLVNDPSLYNDVKRAVNQIGETFEGGEEQGVIRSFFGVLFGALL